MDANFHCSQSPLPGAPPHGFSLRVQARFDPICAARVLSLWFCFDPFDGYVKAIFTGVRPIRGIRIYVLIVKVFHTIFQPPAYACTVHPALVRRSTIPQDIFNSGEKVRVHALVGRFRCQCFDICIFTQTYNSLDNHWFDVWFDFGVVQIITTPKSMAEHSKHLRI